MTKITKIQVSGFRLLNDTEMSLEDDVTVIVGRNNSGKTSVTEVVRRFLSDHVSFRLEDFSLSNHEHFWNAFTFYQQNADVEEVRKKMPKIELSIYIEYPETVKDLGSLGEFIIDLDPDCTIAIAKASFRLKDGNISDLFKNIDLTGCKTVEEKKRLFFKQLRTQIPKNFKSDLYAVDPTNDLNTKKIEFNKLQILLNTSFINAQRGLDDETLKDKDVLGKILETLFNNATSEFADETARQLTADLKKTVEEAQEKISDNFNENLDKLVPPFDLFGYQGLKDPKIKTETELDINKLLSNHTKVRYEGANGVNLPESFNGLGSRNLIYILLKLLEFYKSYRAGGGVVALNTIFIEEPEAHLHPQMQEVFIRQLKALPNEFVKAFGDTGNWDVQFIVSTHSSHIANETPFNGLRYFLTEEKDGFSKTSIKDLGEGFHSIDPAHKDFLHKYMTLTRCDLFFADKVVMIEGQSERLLLPLMIEKTAPKLGSQYLTTIEVGGAYAHIFYPIVDFLNLKTLVITDIDSIDTASKSCKVSEGSGTSNSGLKEWFAPTVSPAELQEAGDDEKIKEKKRICYQVPESKEDCVARSFEGAFILANKKTFSLDSVDKSELEELVWSKTQNIKKADFALKFALEDTDWVTPNYFVEGLTWLETDDVSDSKTVPKVVKKKNAKKK